jgi:hypothetical protein
VSPFVPSCSLVLRTKTVTHSLLGELAPLKPVYRLEHDSSCLTLSVLTYLRYKHRVLHLQASRNGHVNVLTASVER